MSLRVCQNGHQFQKTSSCPVCPVCSAQEMQNTFGEEFPKLSAPAFRALHHAGIKKIADLQNYSEQELLGLHGFGPQAIRLLKPVLLKKGMTLKAKST